MSTATTPRFSPPVALVRVSGLPSAKAARFSEARRKLMVQAIGCLALALLATAFVLIAAPRLDNLVSPRKKATTDMSIIGPGTPVVTGSMNFAVPGQVADEMERLKTRNRRLEALVTVLRARKEHTQIAGQSARIGTR